MSGGKSLVRSESRKLTSRSSALVKPPSTVVLGVGGGLDEGGPGEADGVGGDGRDGARPMMLLAVTGEALMMVTESSAPVMSMASNLLARSVKAEKSSREMLT